MAQHLALAVRHTPSPDAAARMTTSELRGTFLVPNLFEPGRLNLVLTDLDRLLIGGAVPAGPLALEPHRELGTAFFNERRETGIFNIGEPGVVEVSGREYTLGRLDCLYAGMGEQRIVLRRANPDQQPVFYIASCPAHKRYPTALMTLAAAESAPIGDEFHAARRTIRKFIHAGGIPSCQLVMGFTELEPNSVWNTMPPHTHSRRSEIYLYFDLGDGMVVHLLGLPGETRHVIVRDREAVLSPPWSLHSGAGTNNYRFIWVMAGENQDFADIDPVPLPEVL